MPSCAWSAFSPSISAATDCRAANFEDPPALPAVHRVTQLCDREREADHYQLRFSRHDELRKSGSSWAARTMASPARSSQLTNRTKTAMVLWRTSALRSEARMATRSVTTSATQSASDRHRSQERPCNATSRTDATGSRRARRKVSQEASPHLSVHVVTTPVARKRESMQTLVGLRGQTLQKPVSTTLSYVNWVWDIAEVRAQQCPCFCLHKESRPCFGSLRSRPPGVG